MPSSGGKLGEHRPSDPKKVIDRLISRQVGPGAMMKTRCARPCSADGSTDPSINRSGGSRALLQKVQAAAEASTSGRFGDNKVFIVHVWKAVQNDPDFRGMDLLGFKHRLAEANNARLLDLSRADLVQAMDPDDVRLSEVSYLNATFHFIRIGLERL